MSAPGLAAVLYALLAAAPIFVQVALVFGAPWGALTLGGQFPGRLPILVRGVAAGQAFVLVVLVLGVLDAGRLADFGLPDWTIWAVLVVTVLTAIGNLATPSQSERRLWGPVTLAMVACCVVVALNA